MMANCTNEIPSFQNPECKNDRNTPLVKSFRLNKKEVKELYSTGKVISHGMKITIQVFENEKIKL